MKNYLFKFENTENLTDLLHVSNSRFLFVDKAYNLKKKASPKKIISRHENNSCSQSCLTSTKFREKVCDVVINLNRFLAI